MKPQEELIPMRGCIELALLNARDGSVIARRTIENAIVTQGRAWVLAHMLSGQAISTQSIERLALGTDTTAPATGDVALGSETVRKLVDTWDLAGTTSTTPFFRANVQFATDQGNTTLGELGLFNSSVGGTMLGHATFATIDKQTSNTLGVTYTVSN